eukprot:CAMPEP_0177648274 /NCGR_PEP_ID=MMETSP0447-20121125/10743_1 /TAXON_ID=0 /ORGANISM="Stygamoeba regulata, Strain BSH-02190019" /LENGTH=406 /DNA_ID=CAMNT_0019150909 /DNA_START=698 /DNA_END=1918 /DNA_ORIENTATION=-
MLARRGLSVSMSAAASHPQRHGLVALSSLHSTTTISTVAIPTATLRHFSASAAGAWCSASADASSSTPPAAAASTPCMATLAAYYSKHQARPPIPSQQHPVFGTIPAEVKMVEVGPRDGLQNEQRKVGVNEKIELINRLAAAGLRVIEAGSFVSPRWVPQMAQTASVLRGISLYKNVSYPVLTPNLKGFEEAVKSGAKEVSIFGAASDTFSRKNINRSLEESLTQYESLAHRIIEADLPMRGYISCCLGCPYEGPIDPQRVAYVAKRLFDFGCHEIALGDTTGVGHPASTAAMLRAVLETGIPPQNIAVHFHDTYGQALANILTSLQMGIGIVDSSVGGLGGCPYSPGATGNVASEDVLYMLQGLGIETHVDLNKLIDTGRFIFGVLGKPTRSRVATARACATTVL